MKHFYLFLAVLLLAACQKSETSVLSGKIVSGTPVHFENLVLKGCDTLISFQPDSAGCFRLEFKGREIPLFSMDARVIETSGIKWQMNLPVFLEKGGNTSLTLNFKDNQVEVEAGDRDNRAMETCRRQFVRSMMDIWNHTPRPGELKTWAGKLLDKAEEAIREEKPSPFMQEYLRVWSRMEYINAVTAAGHAYAFMNAKVPEDIYEGFPEIPEILDKPYWTMLPNSSFRVTDYLKSRAATSEEQYALLKEKFKTPSLIEDQARQITSHFIFSYPYSPENMKRLEKLAAGLPDEKSILDMYFKKRFSVRGAEVPDIEFEDMEGGKHKLTEFKGKYIYVDLWASWCGPCNAEIPHLKKLEKQLKNSEVAFVSISLDKDRKAWEDKVREEKLRGNQWIAKDNAIGDQLNIPGIPYFLIYDKEGRLYEYKAPRPSHPSVRKMLEGLK